MGEKWTWLQHMDYGQNVNHFYLVGVQPSLFDNVALIRFWGSRQNTSQRVIVQPFDDQASARAAADRLIQQKVKRGYLIVDGYEPPGIEELGSGEPVAGD
jgi:predicted DNA-binding WGR domain protein